MADKPFCQSPVKEKFSRVTVVGIIFVIQFTVQTVCEQPVVLIVECADGVLSEIVSLVTALLLGSMVVGVIEEQAQLLVFRQSVKSVGRGRMGVVEQQPLAG